MHCVGTSGEVFNVHTDKEVCKLLPLKLADSQQESFAQEEDFSPRPLSIFSQWKDLLKALNFILVNDQPGYTHIVYCDRKLGIHCAQEEHL